MREQLEQMGLRLTGEFTLHSGLKSNVKWDIERLFTYPYWVRIKAIEPFIWQVGVRRPDTLVGIPTGGYVLAQDIAKALAIPFYHVSYDTWKANRAILIDDVLTTGETVRHWLRNEFIAVAVLVNRSKLTEVGGIPIITGIFADEVIHSQKNI